MSSTARGPRQLGVQHETEDGECAVCGTPGTRPITVFGGQRYGDGADFLCQPHRAEREQAEAEVAEREDREREQAERRQRDERRIDASGIPRTMRDLPAPDRHVEAVTSARQWIAGELDGLLLTGEPGIGKSYLAAWAAWERLKLGKVASVRDSFGLERKRLESIRWTSGPSLMHMLTQDFESVERHRAHGILTGTGPLVLDDLDKVRATDYGAEQVFLAIDTAVNDGRPLIVTTNYPISALPERWPHNGPAIASRLAGYCRQHALEGRDRRLERMP